MNKRRSPEERINEPGSMQSERIDGFENIETGTPVLYRWIYDRIFWDLDHAEVELTGSRVDFANLIHAAAHLRLVLERVVTASFAASKRLFDKAQKKMESAKDFGEMRKRLKELNPNYWPCSFGYVTHDGTVGQGVRPEVGLQESEVGRSFGLVSAILHAPNPFKKNETSPEENFEALRALCLFLRELLESHVVQRAYSSEFLLLRRDGNGESRVQNIKTDRPLL